VIDLQEAFKGLPQPENSDGPLKIAVNAIPNLEGFYIGKDALGWPVVLVPSDPNQKTPLLPIQLEHLSIAHDLECHLKLERRGDFVGRFTVFRCMGDWDLGLLFLRMMEGLLLTLSPGEPSALPTVIAKLMALFRAVLRPARRTLQGLWAELLLISKSTDLGLMLDSWHTSPEQLHDFSNGVQRLEVKSFSGRDRIHHFSLDQLSPPSSVDLIVASLQAREVAIGSTIQSLVRSVRDQLGDSASRLCHLETVLAETLGINWGKASRIQFDLEVGLSSLRFYEARQVPTIDPLYIPHTITDVRFAVDLAETPPLGIESLLDRGGLLRVSVSKLPN
jgi:hypothetical protein